MGSRAKTTAEIATSAIGFLRSSGIMNSDGGIASTKAGDKSGCWTTAETLEMFVETESLLHLGLTEDIEKMVKFLLNNQEEDGSWELTYANRTVACGCAVKALTISAKIIPEQLVREKVIAAARAGIEWLRQCQGDDGGWGPNPKGGADGSKSRVVSTCIALEAFLSVGERSNSSETIRKAIENLREAQNNDGGWGPTHNEKSDVCNSARALKALFGSHEFDTKDPVITKGWDYIFQRGFPNKRTYLHRISNTPCSGWESTMETFLVGLDYPAHVFFHNHTVYEVLCASLMMNCCNKKILDCLKYFLTRQQGDGSWHFDGEETCTWVTAEGLHLVNLSSKILKQEVITTKRKDLKILLLSALVVIFGITSFMEYLIYSGSLGGLLNWWLSLPSEIRSILLVGIGLGVVVGVISELLHDLVRKALSKLMRKGTE